MNKPKDDECLLTDSKTQEPITSEFQEHFLPKYIRLPEHSKVGNGFWRIPISTPHTRYSQQQISSRTQQSSHEERGSEE